MSTISLSAESRKLDTFQVLDPYALRSVRYSHTDEDGEDFWVLVCRPCAGAGFDLDSDEVSSCAECDGLGESSPLTSYEVRQVLTS